MNYGLCILVKNVLMDLFQLLMLTDGLEGCDSHSDGTLSLQSIHC